jgi:photosystem II stability/assembly factor-like uncharacterized protein
MKHQKILILRLFLCSLLILLSVRAFADLRSTGGPGGMTNNSSALIAFGDTAFIGSNGYCMRTFDGGKTWVKLTEGLGTFPYKINPRCYGRIGNTIYMGCQGAVSVFYTTDFGDHWTSYTTNIPANGITTNAASSDGRVFIAGNGFIPLSYTTGANSGWTATSVGGIVSAISVIGKDSIWATLGSKTYYSHDNGDTWTQIKSEPISIGGLGATDFVKAGNRIIALTNGGGTTVNYYSDDYGNSWKQSTKPFGAGHTFVKISDNEIYADGYYGITADLNLFSAIYKTTDRGDTWIPQGTMPNAFAIAKWKTDDFIVTGPGGLYTSHRDAATAQLIPLPFTAAKSLLINGSNLFALTAEGLYKCLVSGGSWAKVSDLKGYYKSHLNNLEIYNNTLYLSTDSGVFKGDGTAFTEIGGTLHNKNIVSYFISGNTHLAAQTTVTQLSTATDTIYYSADGGAHWSVSPIKFTSQPAFKAIGFMQHNGKLFMTGNTGEAVSTDNGATWTFTNTTIFSYTVAPRLYSFSGVLERERYLYPGGKGTYMVEQSNDNGTTWLPDTVGIAHDVLGTPYLSGVFMADSKLYAYGTQKNNEGLFVKSSPTASWTRVPNTAALPSYPTAMVASGSDLFFAVSDEGVWTTQTQTLTPQVGLELISGATLDFGSHPAGTSATMNIVVKDSSTISATAVSVVITGPDASQFLVGNVPATINAGETVSLPITFSPTGLANTRSAVATINYTGGAGETHSTIVALAGSVSTAGVSTDDIVIPCITPNPAKDRVHITMKEPHDPMQITVIDATGRTVLSTTTLEKDLDVRSLAKGVYIIRVAFGSGTRTEKLVIE